MPEVRLIRHRGAEVEIAADGAVGPVRRAGRELIRRLAVRVADAAGPVPPLATAVDEDEAQWSARLPGDVEVAVRHTFDHTWSLRLLITNDGDREAVIDHLVVDLEPGADAVGWLWPSGRTGRFTVIDRAGRGGLLFTVGRGDLRPGGELGPVRVPAGGRCVLALKGVWFDEPGELFAALPRWLPELDLRDSEPLLLATPDLALAEGDYDAEDGPDGIELFSGASNPAELLLHGAAGPVRLVVGWAPTLQDALADAAAALLAATPRRRGRPSLTPVEALIVLRAGEAGDPERLDVAELALARAGADDPWGVVLGCELALAQTGGAAEEARARALDALAELPARPGAGLAAMHAWLAASLAGQDGSAALAALGRFARDADELLRLEVGLLASGTDRPGLRTAALAELGYGQPGDPLPPRSPEVAAELVTLLRLSGEEGFEAGQVAERHTRRLLARRPSPVSLAWLSTQRPG